MTRDSKSESYYVTGRLSAQRCSECHVIPWCDHSSSLHAAALTRQQYGSCYYSPLRLAPQTDDHLDSEQSPSVDLELEYTK